MSRHFDILPEVDKQNKKMLTNVRKYKKKLVFGN